MYLHSNGAIAQVCSESSDSHQSFQSQTLVSCNIHSHDGVQSSVHSGVGGNDRMAEMAKITEMLRNHDRFITGYYVNLTMSIRIDPWPGGSKSFATTSDCLPSHPTKMEEPQTAISSLLG